MKKLVEVAITVEVEVDEAKFTEEWLTDWRKTFYPFYTIESHIEHIAQMEARGILDRKFTEGYGPLVDMGISAKVFSQDEEIVG